MHLRSDKPGVFEIKIHSMELATLISAARWAADGAKGELTPEAMKQLKMVVRNYDVAIEILNHQKQKKVNRKD